tara:strand:- start:20341 stop:20898 length:558 start_codon:yes stop_codon:yes gene_type:complete
MKLYNYSEDTGEFTGETEARPDPMEGDTFLIPARAALDAPPTPSENEIPVRVDGAWVLHSDYRGQEFWLPDEYDDEKGTKMKDIGNLPAAASLNRPAVPDEIQAERDFAAARKVWLSVSEFYDEFTEAEQYALQTSTDPALIVARGRLAMWRGDVWNDDPRIISGLDALVSAGVINSTRRAAILS